MRARVRRLQRLSTQVVIMMVAILVVTLAAGFAVVLQNLNRQLDVQYEHRALAVAQALASQPGLQQAVLLLWLVSTVAVIAIALACNHGGGQGTCTRSWATFCTGVTSAPNSVPGLR